jgi:signal transduction histidine kinase
LLAAVLMVVGIVVAGTLARWIEADTANQLMLQSEAVRQALVASADPHQPFSVSAARVLSGALGRDMQASVWASDGTLIARSDGFYFPGETLLPPQERMLGSGSSLPGGPGGAMTARFIGTALNPQPALAGSDTIGQLSNELFMNLTMVRENVTGAGGNRVAILIKALDGVPDSLVTTSNAYPEVPPLRMPALPGGAASRPALIALSMSLDREAGGVSTVLTFAAAASALALILGAFVAGRIVRHSLQPVNALAAASQRLAAGDLATRVTIPPSRDEVGLLARAFNDMAVQLDSAFSAQRAFVADASHELRTPLAALRGQVDVMRRALPEQPADADRLATSMRRELARLSRLVDDLLILARIDAGGSAALSPRPVDVRGVAEDVCAQVGALPIAKGRDIQLEPGHPVRITADGERLHQVLLNLVANAVEHTPAGGTARVSVEPSAEGAHIVVRDTGAGIPDSDLPKIFERFYRVDAARQRTDGGGAGLGLSIARAIVEAHGGTISAANCADGGARFVVDVPSQPSAPRRALVGPLS